MRHGIRINGGPFTILNRSEARGRQWADEMAGDFCPLNEFRHTGFDILINTTSVGMSPDMDGMPVARECLNPAMTVMDIVYNPLETRLLREAREIGCTVVNGVAMFVHQGVAVEKDPSLLEKTYDSDDMRLLISRLKSSTALSKGVQNRSTILPCLASSCPSADASLPASSSGGAAF